LADRDYSDPGWYKYPEGTVAYKVDPDETASN